MILTFSREVKDELMIKLQEYFDAELEQELGNFDAEFLLDFLNEHIGPHFYNQAIRDVQKHLAVHLENINERIDELEKPLPDGHHT